MQAAGDTHLQTTHWQHDYPTPDQTDFAPFITAYGGYTHGVYPALGPTYAESRVLYGESSARPTWLIETTYWGEHGATRAQVRYFGWGTTLSTIEGTTFGFGPFWGFAIGADGTTPGAHDTTAWMANYNFSLNQYVTKGDRWYRATTGGQTGSTGPAGTGSTISDGSMTWTYVGPATWNALLNEPAVLDFQRMGSFLDGQAWYKLIPSGLNGMQTLISAGGGTYASWSDGNGEGGGMDWVVSAAAPDGTLLIAYVPDAHSGPLTVVLSAMSGPTRARWYDPSNGTYIADSSGTGYVLANSGTHAFAVPGGNGGGANDWALVLDVATGAEP
jgi:hypothetical protein